MDEKANYIWMEQSKIRIAVAETLRVTELFWRVLEIGNTVIQTDAVTHTNTILHARKSVLKQK